MSLQKLRGWLEATLEGVIQERKTSRRYGRSIGPESKGFLRGRAKSIRDIIELVDRLIKEEEE